MVTKNSKFVLIILLLGTIILNITFFIRSNLPLYTESFNPAFYKKLYGQSQYVSLTPLSMLPDETVYSFAGWEYLHGVNPAVFNADQPPLGKYFIGLSEIWFGNPRIPGPVFNILCLIALFFLANLILRNTVLSLLLVTIFGFETLFIVQMKYAPLLDNIQLFFILLSFIFYILSLQKKWFLVGAFLSLGAVMSVKFWITGLVIYIVWLLHQLIRRNIKNIFYFFLASPLPLVTMLLVYIPSFLQGDSLRRFLGVQKYIYSFHSGKIHFDPLAVWDLLLLNRWHVPWDGTIKPAVDWQITWPIITLLTLLAFRKILMANKILQNLSSPVGVLIILFAVYFSLLSVGALLPRYLIPILPFMYIISFWFLLIRKQTKN